MKKILKIISLSVVIVFCSYSKGYSVKITTESIAKAINNIESMYRAVHSLSSTFTQETYVVVLDKKVNSFGKLYWKKPGNFRIEYGGKKPKHYISNNKKIWIYVPGDTQAEVYNLSEETVPKDALEFMRGFVDIKEFYRVRGWEKRRNETELTLTPKFKGAPYAKLKCIFGKNHLLKSVTIYNITGNISTYNFDDIMINQEIADTVFKFDRPRGVKIVKGR